MPTLSRCNCSGFFYYFWFTKQAKWNILIFLVWITKKYSSNNGASKSFAIKLEET
jgi:hypothetical protein